VVEGREKEKKGRRGKSPPERRFPSTAGLEEGRKIRKKEIGNR